MTKWIWIHKLTFNADDTLFDRQTPHVTMRKSQFKPRRNSKRLQTVYECIERERHERRRDSLTSFTCINLTELSSQFTIFTTIHDSPFILRRFNYSYVERHNRLRTKCVGKWSLLFEWMAFEHRRTYTGHAAEPSKALRQTGKQYQMAQCSPHSHLHTHYKSHAVCAHRVA